MTPSRIAAQRKWRIVPAASASKTPYGLQVIESCLACPLETKDVFCDLPPSVLEGLDAISSSATYPKGAVLFVEGQEPRGVFIICNGRVKLSAASANGKSVILRISESGDVVGLPGTISGKPYEVTAETMEPIQANFILREPFLEFLRAQGAAALRVAEILSDIYLGTYQEVRYLGLSGTAGEKLARFLLDYVTKQPQPDGTQRAVLALTHEEIAEIIGVSRETVTRLFASFKRRGLIEMHGATIVFTNKPDLDALAEK